MTTTNTLAARTRLLGLTVIAAGYLTICNASAPAQVVQSEAGFTHAVTQAIGPPPINQPAPIPSGIIPAACKVLRRGDNILDCYLNDSSNHVIADEITWYFGAQLGVLSWKNWPAQAKSDLRQAFDDTVAWYNGGMQNYPGTLVQDPPQNLDGRFLADLQGGNTILDGPTVAFPIFIGHVALNLASEIYGWIPWSLHNYDLQATYTQFSYNFEFWFCGDYYKAFPTGFCAEQTATPGNAISTFKFLKTNNLIGATRMETIGRVLDWARNHLWHMGNDLKFYNYYNYFQYWGQPPVSRVIEGTITTDPKAPYWWGVPHNWTAGCFGSTAFYQWVFKAANIPVEAVSVGYHQAPYFAGEKLYLSHGDDPYDRLAKTNFPATLLLINKATYDAWFPANNLDVGDKNAGRRPVELSLTYTSPYMLDTYCADLTKNKTHATGDVFNQIYKKYYTVQQLEAIGLWTTLDQKIVGYACPA